MIRSLQSIYSWTIDRSKFREIASRVVVFVLPLFYWGTQPNWWGLAFVGLGLFVRAWGAGCLRKDQAMAQGGPYLLVRHPLYLGSCLLALGLIVALHHWFVTLAIGGVTLLTYLHTIRHEEKNLLARFGSSYVQYCRYAGPLWPTVEGLKTVVERRSKIQNHFSFKQYMKNKEYECALGVGVVLLALFIGS
ncbi:MAG: isoprenylcysteine carboxylmethyltransferase family protein [Bdellovibrionota bacterium]